MIYVLHASHNEKYGFTQRYVAVFTDKAALANYLSNHPSHTTIKVDEQEINPV